MPRNIEIKARIASVETLLPRALAVAGGTPERLLQDDTFFPVPMGRLKLRQFEDGSAELIHYHRADRAQAKASDYVRVPVPDPAALREALSRGLGQLGRVRKQRILVLVGATRVHLDRVEGLGDFLELEVVLQPGQNEADGQAIARALMASLGVLPAQLVRGAYLDLLAERTRGQAGASAARRDRQAAAE